MERPLVGIALAYLIGLVLGEAFTYFPLSTVLAGSVAVAGGVITVFCRNRSVFPLVLLAAMTLIGVLRVQVDTRFISSEDLSRYATGEAVSTIGILWDPIQHGPDGALLDLTAVGVDLGGKIHPARGKLRLRLRELDADFGYGDRIRVTAKLRPPQGVQNPGGFDYRTYLAREGIGAVASIRRPDAISRISPGAPGLFRSVYVWREEIRQTLGASLSPAAASILGAMLIGETRSLSPEIRETFMISGAAHILSISGSHLAFVAGLTFALARLLLRRIPGPWLLRIARKITINRLAVLFTLPPVLFYTLLSGSQAATVRSLIMILVYLATLCVQREHQPLNSLAIAFLIVTIPDPLAIFSISFQMSYTAVFALALAAERSSLRTDRASRTSRWADSRWPWIGPLRDPIQSLLFMTVMAGGATIPFTAHYFNQIAWVGFLSNPIVVPLVGWVIVPLGLVCGIGSLILGTGALPLSGLNEALAGVLLKSVEGFARIPGAELHAPSPPVLVIIALYLIGWILWTRRYDRFWRSLWVTLCLLPVAFWGFRLLAPAPRDVLRVSFLDVGQGDAIWIEGPEGQTLLIDGGTAYESFDMGRLVVGPFLWNTGHRKVDVVVVSHPQRDHVGGLVYVLRKFKVGEIWTAGDDSEAGFYDQFRRVVREKGIPERRVNETGPPNLVRGNFQIRALHPLPPSESMTGAGIKSKDGRRPLGGNDRSLVLRIQYKEAVILLTGDIERGAQRELARWGSLLQSTVLKVPHHGSRSSLHPGFLSGTAPEIAVISVGANNPYGHPAPDALAAYLALGSRIYRTDRDGAVLYRTDGEKHWIRTAREMTLENVSWARGMRAIERNNLRKIIDRYWAGLA